MLSSFRPSALAQKIVYLGSNDLRFRPQYRLLLRSFFHCRLVLVRQVYNFIKRRSLVLKMECQSSPLYHSTKVKVCFKLVFVFFNWLIMRLCVICTCFLTCQSSFTSFNSQTKTFFFMRSLKNRFMLYFKRGQIENVAVKSVQCLGL